MGALKKRLGQAEVRDQIVAARHVVDHSGIVDAQRVAVSGVSYGGYVVGMALSDRYLQKLYNLDMSEVARMLSLILRKSLIGINQRSTECFFRSVARFGRSHFGRFHRPAWAVGSCSVGLTADGTFQNFFFQTLRQSGKNAL